MEDRHPRLLRIYNMIGICVSEQYDPEEFNLVKKMKSAIKISPNFFRISYEDMARLHVAMNLTSTWDIGVELKDFSKEFKEIYSKANFRIKKESGSKFHVFPVSSSQQTPSHLVATV